MKRITGLSLPAVVALFALSGCGGGGGGGGDSPNTVAAPNFSPGSGTYTSAQSVAISTTTPGATIRFTTDDSTPTATVGTPYSGPIAISATTTLKAVAYVAGWNDSPVVAATYVITAPYTVNATTGNDTTGDGVTISYKTITKALSLASYGATVTVAPGTYDSALGEVFPIDIPAGVKLIGDEPNKGNGLTPTLIRGGGNVAVYDPSLISVAVYPRDNTTISGFAIHNDSASASYPIAVVLNYNGVTVKNNRIVDYHYSAIHVDGGGDNSAISGNVAQNNYVGIGFVRGAGPTTRVENNVIRQNSIGVEYDSPATSGDLGGGAAGSAGGNVIASNTINDLWTNFTNSSTIYAANNFWDNYPPTSGSGDAGDDIFNLNGATIITDGGSVAP